MEHEMRKASAVSVRTIAKKAGVSTATVSRVLNNFPNVDPATRDKVLALVRQSKFKPSQVRKRPKHVAFICNESQKIDQYTSEILNGISSYCRRMNLDLSIICMDKHLPDEKVILERRCDGIISSLIYDKSFFKRLIDIGIPSVTVSDSIDMEDTGSVTCDNYSGMKKLMEHIISKGHRKTAFVLSQMEASAHKERLQAYHDVLDAAGISKDDRLLIPHSNFPEELDAGRSAASEFLKLKFPATAIVCMNDALAYGLISSLRNAGCKIPEELSVSGFDDYPISSCFYPPLTTVYQPLQEMGQQAAELIFTAIQQESTVNANIRMQSKLVIRDSIQAPPL